MARYGIGLARPHESRGFPWATWTINVTGCLLIGIPTVLVHAASGTALIYLGMTLIGALPAVWAGTAATKALLRR